jgi:tetratricopeptide (TPR) repeat protein
MKKIITALFVASMLTACNSTSKGQQEFDTATQLAAATKYQEAIAFLAQAVQKDPKNMQYKKALGDLQAKFQSQAAAKVRGILNNDVTNDDLTEAQNIMSSLSDNASNSELTASLLAKVAAAKDALYAQLASQYESASSAYAAGDLVTSYALYEGINEKFTNYEDVSLKLSAIIKEVNQTYLKRANEAIKGDEFDIATTLLNDILAVNPNNNIAKGMLAKVRKNNSPEFFLVKAKSLASEQQWTKALASCAKALALENTNSECLLISSQAKQALNVQTQKDYLIAISSSRLVGAKSLLLALQASNVEEPSLLLEYVNAFTQKSDYVASRHIDNGQYAMAWNLLSAVQEVMPTYPEIFNKIREVEDAIASRAKRSIAVFDFNSPSDSDDAGVIVANNLISRLFNNASNDISILERENLKSILEEMKLGQIGVVSESTAKEMGRVYGIDFAIMGSVLLYKVDENSAQSTKTIRYQTGEKISDNIDYLNWQASNPDPNKKELKSAPQAKVMMPEFGQTEYNVTQTKKVGFIQLSFRIVDVLTGENTRVETIERKLQEQDSANAGVAEAGVIFDPMEIPTDTEILQQLTEQVVESMASEILRPLQQLETFYFNKGQDSERRSEIDNAVEFYTYAIFNEKLKSVSSSPVSREATKRIENLLKDYQFAD